MIDVKRVDKDELIKYSQPGCGNTIFTTYEWVSFLEKNLNAEPVILQLYESGKLVGIFSGLIVKKMGIKILGSPFDGWLTPDMGFIYIEAFDINDALLSVAKYAFETLKCWYVQIRDKKIKPEALNDKITYDTLSILKLSISSPLESIIENFTKNGRRDVRASTRKGVTVKRVLFDEQFVEIYYKQLVDVFAKQNLKPFYGIDKLLDLVNAFKNSPEKVVALVAVTEDEQSIATILSFGFNEWGYYLGAASFREYQKLLPNEQLFLSFIENWKEKNIAFLDLVGRREYKMKYNPEFMEVPNIYFERIPGMIKMKNSMRKLVTFIRKVRGK